MENHEHKHHVEVFIDKKRYESPTPTTGAALYVLGGVDPSKYDLYEEVHGKGDDKLIPDDGARIDLKDGEHFFTVQKKLNPGGIHGAHPDDDIAFLNEKGCDYQLVESGQDIHLIIHRFPFPLYVPKEADLLIRLLSGYPQTPVDMFFTIPDVKLPSGNFPASSDQHPVVGGKQWQQWSRHLTWREGIDNLRTFLAAVSLEISKGI